MGNTTDVLIKSNSDSKEWNLLTTIYPQDFNSNQRFELSGNLEEWASCRLLFKSSTDFYGRIVVYKLVLD